MTRDGSLYARSLLWSATLLAFVGCGRAVGPTSGSVKFDDDSPVQSGSIEFRNIRNKARFASRIARDGTFQPVDEDGNIGLPPGTYEVVVVQIVLTEDLALKDHTHGHTVPRRYADYHTSGLRIKVEEDELEPIEVLISVGDESEA